MGPHSPVTSTVAGANGMLAIATAEGIQVWGNPVTLVADSNRVAEVDASGQVTWMCEASVNMATTTDGPAIRYITKYELRLTDQPSPGMRQRME